MQLFAVEPKDDCPHVGECARNVTDYADVKLASAKCPSCDEPDENWLCLKCKGVFCSRYKNEHALFHFLENDSHYVCLSFSDLSFWCYACDSYVVAPELLPIRKHFEAEKFGGECQTGVEAIAQLVTGIAGSSSTGETGGSSSSTGGGASSSSRAPPN
ncbi:unnamed protein product [Amoebophrya sp. A120]|nr:unnamed protein product [Amoebophrya sp. A120]|eukprot:GSA120T00005288001.1